MWFRIHTTLIHNAKAQSLPPAMFKAWINLLCLAKEGDGVIPSILQVAFHLRLKVLQAQNLMGELEQRGFVAPQPDGTFTPNDWNEHQYKSDVSTDRVKRFREQQRNVSGNVSETSRNVIETPSETDTETESETDTETESKAPRKKRATPASIGARISVEILPDDWAAFALTDCGIDRQRANKVFDQFRDYWISATGANARKADWFATWRNWVRRERSPPGQQQITGKLSYVESVEKVMRERVAEGRPPL